MNQSKSSSESEISENSQGSEKIYRYPGVHSFGVEEVYQKLFFGRDREIHDLFQLIRSNRLIVLYGKSGLGKTSLLQAGIFPRLEEIDLLPLRVRLNQIDKSPMQVLEQEIQNEFEREQKLDPTLVMNHRTTDTWWEYFKTTVFWRGEHLLKPVLILDQFEEIFKLHSRESRGEIAEQLSYLVNDLVPPSVLDQFRKDESHYNENPPDVHVVLSLRIEHVGQLQELFPQIPGILNRRFNLLPMERKQARDAIVKPAQQQLDNFITRPFSYQAKTIDLLLDHLVDKASGSVEPYQLQLQCHHIERQVEQIQSEQEGPIEVDDKIISSSKDLAKVVTGYYLDTIKDFGDNIRSRRAKEAVSLGNLVFRRAGRLKSQARRLCEHGLLSGQGDRIPLSQQQITNDYVLTQKDLDFLVERRLLRKEQKLKSYIYELSHDSLVQPILSKRRFRLSTQAWSGLVGVAFIVMTVVTVIVEQSRRGAEVARGQAEEARQAAELTADVAQTQVNLLREREQENIVAINSKDDEIEALAARVTRLTDAYDDLDGAYSALEQAQLEANGSVEQLASIEGNYTERIEILNTQIADLLLDLQNANTTINNLQADVGPVDGSFIGAPEMVMIAPGRFEMGGNNYADERPQHTVTIDYSFELSKTEVTFEQYDIYALATKQSLPSDEGWGRGTRPVINVSWNDIQGYIEWLNEQTSGGYRLPSEAEWEYAARAGSDTEYSWGDEIGENLANCGGCGSEWDNEQTAPVGSFQENDFGLFDMQGNVWEWVQDCYQASYEGASIDGSAYDSGSCEARVLRGGSWFNNPLYLRSANRFRTVPTNRVDIGGFRLAQDL